jgi:Transglutaminase-like superfamily
MELGIRGDPRYRTVAEARIIELLLYIGWPFEIRGVNAAAAMREAAETLDRWVEMGLPFETTPGGERRFDPAEVQNFFRWAAFHRGDPFWRERFVAAGRRSVREFHPVGASPGPPPPTALAPQRFSVTLRREFNLQGRRPGDRVRLRLPLPLEDDALRDLTIVRLPPLDDEADVSIAPGRLDVRIPVPPDRTASLGIRATFAAYPTIPNQRTATLPPTEIELYTRPSEGIVQVSPRIRALANELAGASREPWAAVRAFWDFMLDRLTIGVTHYDELDPSHPTDLALETGWSDCHLGSALLVALCRARGVPARIINGYLLYPAIPVSHYWTEVWIDDRGWVPFDAMSLELSAKGRDAPWRDYFAGCLDYRMKTQCLPRLFNATPTVRFPPAWHILMRALGDGGEIGVYANGSGALVYRDQISVFREPDRVHVMEN